MKTQIKTCFIVPCYNEEIRLPVDDFETFLNVHPDTLICFVDDGSTDNTKNVLLQICEHYPDNSIYLEIKKNVGKAEAVRQGVLLCNSKYEHEFVAYLDADLSTTPEECLEMQNLFLQKIQFCFASRILRIGSVIQRKRYRFLIGRVIATFISTILHLKVYDTQCGCKMFTKKLSEAVFREKFYSRWLFDVEIFFRIIELFGREHVQDIMLEVPLRHWEDKGNSKISPWYFFVLWKDLFYIRQYYKKRQNSGQFKK
ncbi:MAG: glycosyltransferase [Bacteroidetes bacterium]|nr:glycosyltransferase [Bacteroidota bacterium]